MKNQSESAGCKRAGVVNTPVINGRAKEKHCLLVDFKPTSKQTIKTPSLREGSSRIISDRQLHAMRAVVFKQALNYGLQGFFYRRCCGCGKGVDPRISENCENKFPSLNYEVALERRLSPCCCEACLNKTRNLLHAALTADEPRRFCRICFEPLTAGSVGHICLCCEVSPPPFNRFFSVCWYTGLVKALLRSFKYHSDRSAGKVLSGILQLGFSRLKTSPDFETPPVEAILAIPSSLREMRQRQFCHCHYLAAKVGAEQNIPFYRGALLAGPKKRRQAELSLNEREENVRDTFITSPKLPPLTHVLLIDDVVTSGSSIYHACLSLRRQQPALKITVLTCARSPAFAQQQKRRLLL